MDADRIVAAVRRHLLRTGETVEKRWDWPDAVALRTADAVYEAQPTDWLIAREPWVAEAVRVTVDLGIEHAPVATYGLLLDRAGRAFLLSDAATMRGLGRRLGDDLDPLAYAELLAELYSGPDIAGPVVAAPAVTGNTRAGWLVRDPGETVARFPFIDAGLLAPPVVRRVAGRVELEFRSVHYFLSTIGGAADILRWTVTGAGGQDASWSREYVAERIERS